MARKKLVHYHSSQENAKPTGMDLGEIAVVHVSSDPGLSKLYVETVSGSSNSNTLAEFVTKSYVDSANTEVLGFIGDLADLAVTEVQVNGTTHTGNTVNLGSFLSADTEYVKSVSQTTAANSAYTTTTLTMNDNTTSYNIVEQTVIDCGTY
jgi:hypothetical protein